MNLILVWAWWTWMSGVAWILHNLWYTKNIVCLDKNESELTKKLESNWIKTIIWQNKYIPEITDHVIYSEACINSPEVQKAKSYTRNPKEQRFIWNYFDFLWELSKYFTTVWVAWTNWKSSTTAITIHTAKNNLEKFWLWILWALVPDLNWNNFYVNDQKKEELKNIFDYIFTWKWLNYDLIKKYVFILEACEYKRHFLKLDIDRWIITNIELDHTDYYKDFDDYKLAFQQFSEKTKNKILFCPPKKGESHEISWLGISKNKFINTTIQNFNFKHLFWEHNNQNWTFALELITQLKPNTNKEKIIKDIENFKWLRRRLEFFKKTKNGTMIFSDYWHMSSSIKHCHKALKQKYWDKNLVAIFQPHQINRVLRERNKFWKVLKLFDETIIYDIYAARENLEEQINQFSELKLKKANSINDLWEFFAQSCGWKYTTKKVDIFDRINSWKNNEIITIFSAWDLDFIVRNFLQ